jgi:hypothetical protein
MNGSEMAVSFTGPSGDLASPMPNLGVDAVFGGYYTGGPDIAWAGYIGEVLLYDHALADVERQSAESYLRAKWV